MKRKFLFYIVYYNGSGIGNVAISKTSKLNTAQALNETQAFISETYESRNPIVILNWFRIKR